MAKKTKNSRANPNCPICEGRGTSAFLDMMAGTIRYSTCSCVRKAHRAAMKKSLEAKAARRANK